MARGRADRPKRAPVKEEFRAFDAEIKFAVEDLKAEESAECVSGLILQGVKKPHECPAFASRCTPEHPLGATMVSSEGRARLITVTGTSGIPRESEYVRARR